MVIVLRPRSSPPDCPSRQCRSSRSSSRSLPSRRSSAWEIRYIKSKITLLENNLKAVLYSLRCRVVRGWYYTFDKIYAAQGTCLAPHWFVLCKAEDIQEPRFREMRIKRASQFSDCAPSSYCLAMANASTGKRRRANTSLLQKGSVKTVEWKAEIPKRKRCPRLGRAKQRRSQEANPAHLTQLTISFSAQRADELQISISGTKHWVSLSGQIK